MSDLIDLTDSWRLAMSDHSDPPEPKPSISRRLKVLEAGTPYPRPTSLADREAREAREALADSSRCSSDASLSPSKRQLPQAFQEGPAHCLPKVKPVTLASLATLQNQREQTLPSVVVVPAKPGFPKPAGPLGAVVVPARPEEDLAKGRPVVVPPPEKHRTSSSDKVDWFYHVSPCMALASSTPKSWPLTPPASAKSLIETPEKSEKPPPSPLSEMDLCLGGPGVEEAKQEFEEIEVEEEEDWRLLPDHET